MGLRAVTDLSEYTVPELIKLIQLATELLREKLRGGSRETVDPWSDSSSGVSVVEASAGSRRAASIGSWSVAAGSASSAGAQAEVIPPPQPKLKNPLTCEYHCRFCEKQCIRPGGHKNHACFEPRKLR